MGLSVNNLFDDAPLPVKVDRTDEGLGVKIRYMCTMTFAVVNLDIWQVFETPTPSKARTDMGLSSQQTFCIIKLFTGFFGAPMPST